MVTVAICDSEILFRKNIIACCRQYLQGKNEEYKILEYESGEDVLMASFPDILLMDVKLKGINGLLVKEVLWRKGADTRIIFVSETKRWMPEAFGKNVFGYLVKPLKYTSFCDKMDTVLDDFRAKRRGIYCKTKENIEYVLFKDIVYVKANGRHTRLYLNGREEGVPCQLGIGQWVKQYGEEGFVRVNRMHLVNPAYVVSLERGDGMKSPELELSTGISMPITKTYEATIQERYLKWKAKYR